MPAEPNDPEGLARVQRWAEGPEAAAQQAARAAPEVLVARQRAEVLAALQRESGHRWRKLQEAEDGEAWRTANLVVIWSVARAATGPLFWLHVSVSHRNRLPTWAEMALAKRLFIGPERWACQLHPPAAEHVNLHSRVLHLWAPWRASDWPLPDLSATLPDGTRTV